MNSFRPGGIQTGAMLRSGRAPEAAVGKAGGRLCHAGDASMLSESWPRCLGVTHERRNFTPSALRKEKSVETLLLTYMS